MEFFPNALPVALPDSLVAVHGGGGFLRVIRTKAEINSVIESGREFLPAVHGFHQAIQTVSNIHFEW
jgi:hypothetical protein